MSYNGSGTFNINSAGQPVVTGTTITSTAFNALTADLATGLSTAITKDGQTATTARIPFVLGVSSTLTTDATSATTGSIITAGGISAQKALWVGTTANVAGTTDATNATTGTITTAGGISAQKALYIGSTATITGAATAPAFNSTGGTGTVSATGGVALLLFTPAQFTGYTVQISCISTSGGGYAIVSSNNGGGSPGIAAQGGVGTNTPTFSVSGGAVYVTFATTTTIRWGASGTTCS